MVSSLVIFSGCSNTTIKLMVYALHLTFDSGIVTENLTGASRSKLLLWVDESDEIDK